VVDSLEQPKPTAGRTPRLEPFQIYVACVSGLGVALFFWSLTHVTSSAAAVLLFIGLVIVADLTTSENLAPQLTFSMDSAVTFATLFTLGPLAAILVATIGGMVSTLVMPRSGRSPLLQRAFFNMAGFGLPVPVAGGIYLLFGGRIGEVALLSNLLPMVLAAISFEVVNAGLVVGVVSLQTRQPALKIWRHNVSWIAPMNVLSMVVGGGGVALGYEIAGILGVLLPSTPLDCTWDRPNPRWIVWRRSSLNAPKISKRLMRR
jgi:hypothetical protein